MNTNKITEQIYKRHLLALRRVSGEGTWMDESAVRMALWLSLTEQAERLEAEPAPDVSGLQDAWAAEAAANERLKDEMIKLRGRCAALEDNQDNLQAALAAAQDRAAMLRQQKDELEELYAVRGMDLANEIANNANLSEELAQFKALQVAPVALASLNGHGDQLQQIDHPTWAHPAAVGAEPGEPWAAALPPAYQALAVKLENGELKWNNLTRTEKAAILTTVLQQMKAPITMKSYDQNRPHYMPTASALAMMFGDGLWKQMMAKVAMQELA